MNDVKQVKVDNWGIYFLQRLKHFFNRTDYCDLTLQFQDNAQLKVHRLVLNACTEYFEILERTCEMYEDCLIMPDDLQADVVVPIVNFMYTGQLEFKMDLLEKLYQTSVVMNMPVLTKLLDSHRVKMKFPSVKTHPNAKRYSRNVDSIKKTSYSKTSPSNSQFRKRTFEKAFEEPSLSNKEAGTIAELVVTNGYLHGEIVKQTPNKPKPAIKDPKPTRYELPAELDEDNIFENSFTSISYTSKPLMVHPATTKQYAPKKSRLFDEPSSSKSFLGGNSTLDVVECRKLTESEDYEDDCAETILGDSYIETHNFTKNKTKDSSQLFDQILVNEPSKVTIEAKDRKQMGNLDHAKIISEVLKKYPHLVKSNKNIKLKILNTPNNKPKKPIKPKVEVPDFTYESDVVDSKEAARLIALGAENVKGPWICLICGTPGKALHFTSYFKYRRHLVDIHHEKPVSTMCEHCGLKSSKRNYLLHHMYTKHGIEPPAVYKFPKCNVCDYVALTENLLVKHKLSHTDNRKFRCTICAATFRSTNLLLTHIQKSGHKYTLGKNIVPQCIYCSRTFSRDTNLYAHLKAFHYKSARADGILEESDEERQIGAIEKEDDAKYIEVEFPSYDTQLEELYNEELKGEEDNIEIVMTKKSIPTQKSKILNSNFSKSPIINKTPSVQNVLNKNEYIQSNTPKKQQEIVVIDNNEYILQDFQLIPKQENTNVSFMSDNFQSESDERIDNVAQSSNCQEIYETKHAESDVILKSHNNVNEPIQIVVSNEEEYNALIASNHSIIFDNTNSNKSLTVLTAPNTTTVANTAMAINTTSSNNNMMIIQEDYSINTSEANLTDNPNIVVVYGHPVEDNSKQYQLITSQAIDTQYIQSAAILTKNLETISTTTPIASSHDISHIATVETNNSWQSNIHNNIAIDPIEVVTSEAQIISQESETVDADEENTNLIQLPEVSLTITQETIPNQLIDGQLIDNANNNPSFEKHVEVVTSNTYEIESVVASTTSQTAEPMVEEPSIDDVSKQESQNDATNTISIVCPTQVTLENINETDVNNENIVVMQSSGTIENSVIVNISPVEIATNRLDQNNMDNMLTQVDIQNDLESEHQTINTNMIQIDSNSNDDEETIENIAKDIGVDPRTLDTHPVCMQISTSDCNKIESAQPPQIASLTSEWSDDEIETVTDDATNKSEVVQDVVIPQSESVSENLNHITIKSNENVSECNIDIKVAIMSEGDGDKTTEVVSDNSKVVVNDVSQESIQASQEKLSSLLNDWEDSQDNSMTNNEVVAAANEEILIETPAATMMSEQVSQNNDEVPVKSDTKHANIRSLVSDWDEDDDDDNK